MTGLPVILLLGPTASGKSAISMAIARRIPIEVVSVDSALVYRDMDIGTAKPTPDELRAVPHHLIDILDPAQAYSAARFADEARALISAIRARGRLPLLVGGTMLYAKTLIEGIHDLPGADPALRVRLDAQAQADGWPALHARLAELDPATAARLKPNDAQRIQRALEVIELTGVPLSRLLAGRPEGAGAERFVRIALEPSDRSVLHARIAERFGRMLEDGFLDEVERLRARGDLDPGMPSMRCVGYRQAWEHLDGQCNRATMIERAIAATRQLAKRQLTWLRSMPDRITVDALSADAFDRVIGVIEQSSRATSSPS
ncbi:MAG: tRNA dimethylallyltransferase [Pseudomonadota bacterium]|jgi:tRNA dimethylallyltransferase